MTELRQPDYMRLLTPEAIESLSKLQLLARGVVEGLVAGSHKSPYKGFSSEFVEHRQYVAGDDVRDLDWRVYGKSDRYYVKQYEEETNLRATILLDASGSMRYAGDAAEQPDGNSLSKFSYAQFLAASLAYLLAHQQDAVGLVTMDHRIRRHIPARGRPGHLHVLLEQIHATTPGEESKLAPILHDIAESIHRRGLVIIISDFFDNIQEILNALHHFRYRKHEVIVMHIMADEELSFPFEGWSDFRDLEIMGRNFELDPRSVRAGYLNGVRDFIAALEGGCGRMQADYVQFNTRQPYVGALSNYLSRRQVQI